MRESGNDGHGGAGRAIATAPAAILRLATTSAAPRSTPALAPAQGRAAVRVLVVDDEPSICKALAITLKRDGFEVLVAHGGEEALALLRTSAIDAMLVDLRMPDLRGDVLFHLATSLQPHLAQRTLFTTGDISERAQLLIRACDCPMVRKPFELGDILDALRAMTPDVAKMA